MTSEPRAAAACWKVPTKGQEASLLEPLHLRKLLSGGSNLFTSLQHSGLHRRQVRALPLSTITIKAALASDVTSPGGIHPNSLALNELRGLSLKPSASNLNSVLFRSRQCLCEGPDCGSCFTLLGLVAVFQLSFHWFGLLPPPKEFATTNILSSLIPFEPQATLPTPPRQSPFPPPQQLVGFQSYLALFNSSFAPTHCPDTAAAAAAAAALLYRDRLWYPATATLGRPHSIQGCGGK